MDDPVVTPSGITYERALLVEHLKRNGPTDPITRYLYGAVGIHNAVVLFFCLM